MKKVLFAVSALFAAFTVAAQEQQLQPIDRPVLAKETRCLPFFVATDFGGATEKHVIFSYKNPDGNTKGDAVAKLRVTVVIREGAPTYEKTPVDGSQDGAIFRLGQKDYDQAKACLPVPKPN